MNSLIFLPMATPEIILGASLLTMFVAIGSPPFFPLNFLTILIAHIMFNISYVVVTVRARLAGFPRHLEEAAMDLFANEWQTFWKVTFPLILPGIVAAALLAFSLSIDDFVITNFTAGKTQTFPMFIYAKSRIGIPVQVNVIGTCIFLIAVGQRGAHDHRGSAAALMGRPGTSGGPVPATPLGAVGIEDAARIIGTSPSSLRLWERQGLVSPARTPGGARRYLAEDVERLRRIRTWRTVDGLNAAAIRRLLERDGNGAVRGRRPAPRAGRNVRPRTLGRPRGSRARNGRDRRPARRRAPSCGPSAREQGLTLREVARRSGLSASFISSFELGTSGASIATLRRLVGVYGLTVGELLRGAAPSGGRLVRPHERRVLDAGRGIRIEDLFAGPATLESQLFVLAPGRRAPTGTTVTPARSSCTCWPGRSACGSTIRNEFYRLEPGDALTFPSTQDHRIQALGAAETHVLWINTPPTF